MGAVAVQAVPQNLKGIKNLESRCLEQPGWEKDTAKMGMLLDATGRVGPTPGCLAIKRWWEEGRSKGIG